MIIVIDPLVNSETILNNPDSITKKSSLALKRRRMNVVEREKHILDGAIQFFAQNGMNGQLRDLAKSIGVTHALLYHYFPTKQDLINRVYLEVFEGRWKDEWDDMLNRTDLNPEEKLTAFYTEYVNVTLSSDFVRILVYSGLSDHAITDRFFALLRKRLFPQLIRETRTFRGISSRAKPTKREVELLMGLHGGFFYITMRRWIYQQGVYNETTPNTYEKSFIRDRVKAYLYSSEMLFSGKNGPIEPRERNLRATIQKSSAGVIAVNQKSSTFQSTYGGIADYILETS
jgi:AcrR family transcriptional regulator